MSTPTAAEIRADLLALAIRHFRAAEAGATTAEDAARHLNNFYALAESV